MAAAAATLSDSSPPGWAMRTDSWPRAASPPTPCPSCPSAQAQGQGRLLVQEFALVRTGHDHRHVKRVAARRRPALRPAAARNARPCRRAAPWAPQRRRALEREHLAKAEGRGAAQHGADIAGVLHPVQDHRGARRLQRRRRRQIQHEAHARRRLQPADLRQQRIRDHDGFESRRAPIRRGLAARTTRRIRRSPAAGRAQRGAAQVVALQPDPALLAVGRAVLGQPAQVLEQGVVARGDELRLGGGHEDAARVDGHAHRRQ